MESLPLGRFKHLFNEKATHIGYSLILLHQQPPLEGDRGAAQGGCLRVCAVPKQRIRAAGKNQDRYLREVHIIPNHKALTQLK